MKKIVLTFVFLVLIDIPLIAYPATNLLRLPDWVRGQGTAGGDCYGVSDGNRILSIKYAYGDQKEFDELELEELSSKYYLTNPGGGRIINLNGEIVEFIDWNGMQISRVLTPDDQNDYYARAAGVFKTYSETGRMVAYQETWVPNPGCGPGEEFWKEGAERCYVTGNIKGILTVLNGDEIISVEVERNCEWD